jgi:hypothetical protein
MLGSGPPLAGMMSNHFAEPQGDPMESEAPTDRVEAVTNLLREAESAHGTYEALDLGGVYDRDWPSWYAEYLIEHGLDEIVGHATPLDRVGPFLANAYAEFEQLDPRPDKGEWAAYIARRIVEDL